MQADTLNDPSQNWQPALLLLCCSATLTGCAMFDAGMPKIFEKEPEFRTPHQVIPLWSDTVLHQAGRKGQRGCGGRFMFYTGDSQEGVRVDGTITIYVWNDTQSGKQRKPDKKYVFPAEKLQNHYSKSKVGHSYSFWIPWDEAGSDRTELTVVARFVGRDGSDITTPASKVILPGPVSMPAIPQTTQQADGIFDQDSATGGIQQIAWDTKRKARADKQRTLRSSEIRVSPGFVKRNQQTMVEGLSAADLFSDPMAPVTSEPDSFSPTNRTQESEQPLADSELELEKVSAGMFSERVSTQRAARSLQSRFQARRERVAQRSSSSAETQQSRSTSP